MCAVTTSVKSANSGEKNERQTDKQEGEKKIINSKNHNERKKKKENQCIT